jgi:DNA-binding response OmpR family regulator
VVDGIMRRVTATRIPAEQVTLDTAHMQISGPNGISTLTPPDVILLKNLAEAPARKLAYWRLQELLQIAPDDNGKAALEVRISRLKKKMHDAGVPDPAIKSLWKEGYQLCVPVQIVP